MDPTKLYSFGQDLDVVLDFFASGLIYSISEDHR